MSYWTNTTEGRRILNGVLDAQSNGWKQRAIAAVVAVGERHPHFTSDLVAKELGERPSRNLGPVILGLARQGIITKVGRTTEDVARTVSHGAPVSVWSLVYGRE